MSTIHDALKKAQAGKESQIVPGAPSVAPASASVRPIEIERERRKSGMNWGPVFVVLVLLLITGPILAPLLTKPFRTETVTAPQLLASNPTDQSGARKGQFAIEEAPLRFVQLPSLNLSGVVYAANEESYAIINDKVVKSGESVGGAKLVRVTPDKVTLMYQGQQVELPVAQA